jgi:hypothetical protein
MFLGGLKGINTLLEVSDQGMHGVSRCDVVECAVCVGVFDRLSDEIEAVVEATVDAMSVEKQYGF